MQAITIAIGKAGIDFFAQHYLVDQLLQLVKQLAPPNKNIPVADFETSSTTTQDKYTNIQINLQNGSLTGFSPQFQNIAQNAGGIFPLTFLSNRFQVNYQWLENYALHHCDGIGKYWECKDSHPDNEWPCDPQVGSLTITVNIVFTFNSGTNLWEMSCQGVTAAAPNVQTNIPADSILLSKASICAKDHVTDTINSAISAIDFDTPINGLIKGMINSIPGSGDLGNGIVYDFSMGDSGILFPNNDGIQMGVKGGTSYDGIVYSGDTPPSLPLPLPPSDVSSDARHFNMYVSNYEIDALNWGYFKAGKLNMLLHPGDIPDSAALHVSNYTALEPTLNPYAAFVMYAQITQNTAPVTAFQVVYLFPTEVMNVLQKALPNNVYSQIQGLEGGAYISKTTLETFLSTANVPTTWFDTIENTSKLIAMVLTQDIEFTLLIQNGQPTPPDIKFQVQRVDVLTNLALGMTPNKNQTLQYGFTNATNKATFISSSIPNFNGQLFGEVVWPVTAEPMYAQNLEALGEIGTPLPIMQGFQFDFTNADISPQEGYVAISANVLYKNQ